MTRPIRVLPEDLASQIAAGEVVERPASVVKELIENALDAGAHRIEISIAGGGITSIEVADDGYGMSTSEAPLCLGRHATSKLRDFAELEQIGSYGFRGEALPSVASVSRLSVRTRSRDSDSGTLVEAEGTTEGVVSPVGSPVGTTLSVRDLFYNVPARRKFLRSSNTESGHVTEVVVDAALSRPEVAFSLTRDGRKTKNFQKAASQRLRVQQVLSGEELARCVGERGPLQVEAYLSSPHRARQGAGGLKILVNQRPVKDRALAATVAHAYQGALEKGRYPRGVVYLTLPGRLVDVNVHPQKTEVRFADPRAVADALYSVVSKSLAKGPFANLLTQRRDPVPTAPASTPRPQSSARVLHDGGKPVSGTRFAPARVKPRAPVKSGPTQTGATWKGLRVLGLACNRYIVCEGDQAIVILDQHAAHERVLLTELRRDFFRDSVPSQAMLFPETVSLDRGQDALVEQWGPLFVRLGLDVRLRSAESASIHSSPRILSRSSAPELLTWLLARVAKLSNPKKADWEPILAHLACTEAVAPGERVQRDWAEALLRSLLGADFELDCEHGKVILTELMQAELERKAGRRD